MGYTLEDVKQFIEEFTELEYQFGIGFYDNSINDEEWESLVSKLESCYSVRFGFYSITNTIRDESYMNEEELSNEKDNLKKRRLFLIRKYEKPVFGKGMIGIDTDVVFSCFLGSNINNMSSEKYYSNVSLGVVNGELKVITERELNFEKRRSEEIIEWIYNKRSNVYTEALTIKKDGKLVDTLRVFEPDHPTWLADYNS
ncbi:hypothetical protein ACLI1A_17015 [Flavobacterium sp. RHBU_3]|uniref:hypothetical protein n=1 Tax=Flavobacterium sp. RHBU_3 TaxID=3391184 RepID=UPI003985078E